jgi:predicted permease
MSAVLSKMAEVAILLAVGFAVGRLGVIRKESSRDISTLVLDVCNPALIVSGALADPVAYEPAQIGIIALACVAMYAAFIGFGWLFPRIMRRPRDERAPYAMLSTFGSVGFVGIPLGVALLGTGATLPIVIVNVVFNLLFYTYGQHVMAGEALRRAQERLGTDKDAGAAGGAGASGGAAARDASAEAVESAAGDTGGAGWRKLVNPGTIACLVAIVLYLVPVSVPAIITESLEYLSSGTIFLSMLVLGMALAASSARSLFGRPMLYVFWIVRILVLPVCVALVLRACGLDELAAEALALMCAMPGANMPIMLAEQLGVESDLLTAGVLLSSVMCLVTIPLVTLVFA